MGVEAGEEDGGGGWERRMVGRKLERRMGVEAGKEDGVEDGGGRWGGG